MAPGTGVQLWGHLSTLANELKTGQSRQRQVPGRLGRRKIAGCFWVELSCLTLLAHPLLRALRELRGFTSHARGSSRVVRYAHRYAHHLNVGCVEIDVLPEIDLPVDRTVVERSARQARTPVPIARVRLRLTVKRLSGVLNHEQIVRTTLRRCFSKAYACG